MWCALSIPAWFAQCINMDNKLINSQRIRVRGLVQGVGFRPFVWRLANECQLMGEVSNDAGGVLIKISGPVTQIDRFVERLRVETPPLARIDELVSTPLEKAFEGCEFIIARSQSGEVRTTIVPDASTCDDCLEEITNPDERRFGYPFTNCTNCGPRLTITRGLPYDRANTSMSVFPMCEDCRREYEDPADRRFHAQPVACSRCGPSVWLVDKAGEEIAPPDGLSVLKQTAQLIQNGRIVAIRGLGGFHLACDGSDAAAITCLRQRKRRYDKPLALMVRDFDMARRFVRLDDTARSLMRSPQAPIVLLQKKAGGELLPDKLTPGQNHLGMMLPYTPLHHLLMNELDQPIVLTSGNRSNEPQLIDNEEALARLAGIADAWLMHDRAIVNRVDDSVVQLVAGAPQIMRRARGYAPEPFVLPDGFKDAPAILAMGGELKNTFCLLKNGQVIVSQHIGDLENPAAHRDYRKNLELYHQTNEFAPERIAVDLHPDYFSTRLGAQMAADAACPLDHIQHHHAHIAACLAEHHREIDAPPVLGVVWDGLGYGADDRLWGGEFLLADYKSCKRMAHFLPVALPGGVQAHFQPWRNSFAHLLAAFDGRGFERQFADLDCIKHLQTKPLDQVEQMIERGLNSPKTSSAGRLFDAVAAILGLCPDAVSYEGQAAMQLQALAQGCPEERGDYGFAFEHNMIGWSPLWGGILEDLQNKTEPAIIAVRFHNSLIRLIEETASGIAAENNIKTIVLTGGVFQNSLLLAGAAKRLQEKGLRVLSPMGFPANDGGLSLGQAVISAALEVTPIMDKELSIARGCHS